MKDFSQDENVLKTNNKFALCTKKPDEIFQLFNEEMKSENASKSIRLIDQFSKSFAESDKHKPIFQLEGIALLYALDHFRLDILRAPLSVLVTDSRVAFLLFSGKVQQSCKKLINNVPKQEHKCSNADMFSNSPAKMQQRSSSGYREECSNVPKQLQESNTERLPGYSTIQLLSF